MEALVAEKGVAVPMVVGTREAAVDTEARQLARRVGRMVAVEKAGAEPEAGMAESRAGAELEAWMAGSRAGAELEAGMETAEAGTAGALVVVAVAAESSERGSRVVEIAVAVLRVAGAMEAGAAVVVAVVELRAAGAMAAGTAVATAAVAAMAAVVMAVPWLLRSARPTPPQALRSPRVSKPPRWC